MTVNLPAKIQPVRHSGTGYIPNFTLGSSNTGNGTAAPPKGFKMNFGKFGRVANSVCKYGGKFFGSKILRGTVAALAAVATGYSIFKDGYEKGVRNAKETLGQYYADIFMSTNSSPRYSHLLEAVRRPIENLKFDDPVYPAIVRTQNVIASTAEEVVENALPLLLTFTTAAPMMLKNMRNTLTGKVISGVSAGILLFEGATQVINEFLGIGKKTL